MLPDDQITKFQTLYENRFNKKIDRAEAHERATKLIQFIRLVYQPMVEKIYQNQQNYEIHSKTI